MKIGLVIYDSLDILSGGYLYDRRLVENLTAMGDEVAILPLKSRSYALCLIDNLSSRVKNILLEQHFDILLEDELTHPSLFHLNPQLRRLAAFPIVGIIHHLRINERHPAVWRPIYRAVESRFLNSLDGMICNSHATWQSVEKAAARSLPSVIAYPAADHYGLQLVRQEVVGGEKSASLRILFVGNIIPRKGLGVLLSALENMRDRNWSLTVAGSTNFDPAYASRMMESARRALPSQKVAFTGRLSDEELLAKYLDHDLLVVPSIYEGFGIVYLEAMRFGLVPIGTTGGGAGEIITPGKDGFLIAPGDVDGLAAILKNLLDYPEKLQILKTNAQKRAGEFPSWQESARGIRNFLVELIESHSAVKS